MISTLVVDGQLYTVKNVEMRNIVRTMYIVVDVKRQMVHVPYAYMRMAVLLLRMSWRVHTIPSAIWKYLFRC